MIDKGAYILVFDLPDIRVKVGALGFFDLKKGSYVYVGSAMNGLDHRIKRHMTKKKKLHWHIDYLTRDCGSIEAYEAVYPGANECGLGEIVRQYGGIPAVNGFGCSDCKCQTHLFLVGEDVRKRFFTDSLFKIRARR
jgi:Uri superfamily endonuclease